jgi:P4 family phage/plasmid primase-like protien
MNNDLVKFLNPLRDTTEFYTNGSQMLPNTGKFKIERSNLEEFWELYQDLLFKLGDEFMAGLNERPKEFMPILGDIDIALPYDDDETLLNKPLYTQHHVKQVISIYLDIIKSVLPGDYSNEHLYCFLLEKPKPYVSGERIKHGFHIHFPFLFMSNIDQDMHVIPRVRRRVEDEKIFEDIGILHSGDVIDKSCSRQHWLLYGSRKDTKLDKYNVSKIYDYKGNQVTLERALKYNKLYNIEDDEIVFENPLEYYLPRILSISPSNRQIYTAKNTIKVMPKEELKKANESKLVKDNLSVPQALKIAEKLMPLIEDSRASVYDTKMEIGWILFNISDGSQEGLEMWLDFLQRDPEKYNEAKAVYRWTREMKKKGLSIGSLKFIARKDNPEKYEALHREQQKDLLYKSLLGGHRDIAVQLYEKYGGQYVCADVSRKLWYEFREHRWVRCPEGISLKSKISTDILLRYTEEGAKMFKVCGEDLGSEQSQENSNKIKQLNKVIASLNSAPFKNNVMVECMELFYKEDFLEKLDRNIYLTGFNNGVLDLKQMEFRSGRPDDYVSLSTGYDWKDFDDDDNEVLECGDFLLKLFPNPLIRRYAVEYFASILKSGNFQKTFVIMTGEGDNGKSVLIEVLEKVLGDYMEKLPTSLITSGRTQSSGSTMDTELLRKKKYGILQETSKKDQINDGKLKELTGNDTFQSRAHYGAFSKVEATAKIALICNKLPSIGSDDPAIWNRVRVLPFESRFPKNNDEVPATYEEQIAKKTFFRDNNFSEKIPYMRQAFVWIMFQTFKYVSRHGYSREPQQVIEATENYKINNDSFLQFTNERIIKDESPDCEGITLSEIHNLYKEWYRETYNNSNNCPNKNELKEYLYKKWGVARLNKWKKYRIRTIKDDELEGELLALRPEDYTDNEE